MWVDVSRACQACQPAQPASLPAHEGGELPPPGRALQESLHTPSPWAAAWRGRPYQPHYGLVLVLSAPTHNTALQHCNNGPVRPQPNEATWLQSDRLTTPIISQHNISTSGRSSMIGRYGCPGLARSAGTTLHHFEPSAPDRRLRTPKHSLTTPPTTNHQRRSTTKRQLGSQVSQIEAKPPSAPQVGVREPNSDLNSGPGSSRFEPIWTLSWWAASPERPLLTGAAPAPGFRIGRLRGLDRGARPLQWPQQRTGRPYQ